ncbi:MAG: methyltransferase [Gammaproteobacteria bacterium]|nr:methyltransferase [Gammaproteobacteria bacterium]
MRKLLVGAVAMSCFSVAQAQFEPPVLSPVAQKIQAAMQSEIRTAQEKDRDENRSPVKTLEFMGLSDDMRVVELVPGGGWYTKILAAVLADKGEFYVGLGTRRIPPLLEKHPELSAVKILPVDVKFVPAEIMGLFELGEFSLAIDNVDMVLTFRNLHNFTTPSRVHINRAVFDALRPGGLYGVVDHTRRHNEPANSENWRRLDPVLVIKEIQDAGFELVDSSDVHYRPDDELRYEVGRKTVAGNTDRFTLLFRKPD